MTSGCSRHTNFQVPTQALRSAIVQSGPEWLTMHFPMIYSLKFILIKVRLSQDEAEESTNRAAVSHVNHDIIG